MNIALVILHADPARGGAERYTVDLAAALARRGHAVSLLASSHGAQPPHPSVRPVKIAAWGLGRRMKYGCFLAALNDEIEKGGYDIVHAMLPVDRCDVYHPHAGIAAVAAQKWNVAFNPRRGAMARVERKLLTGDRPPITIALSQYIKRSILEHYPLPDDRLATLFNAVDLEHFAPVGAEREYDGLEDQPQAFALMLANDFERKGLPTAIKAAARVGRQLQLTAFGKEDPEPYRRLARSLNARVAVLPAIEDPRTQYGTSDFFVLPTKHDPCSLVVLEALAMGLPVISTVFNGATEIMEDGVHGYVLNDPADVDALADAMRKMLDPDRRRAMSEACLALRPRLSYEHHLDELMRIYDRAVADRTRLSS